MLRFTGIPKASATHVPTGKIWPAGDFSLGYRRVEGDSRVDLRSHLERIDAGEMTCPDRPGWSVGPYGFPVYDAAAAAAAREADGGLAPLNLTNARNSHTPPSRPEKYGKTGITGYGKKMVRSAVTLMESGPARRLTFATVTMPTLPAAARTKLASCWPEFVRQLLQWLTRRLEGQALPRLVASVTEVQPARLERDQEAYLHLHLVWPNRVAKAGNWAIDVMELRAWCDRFLSRRGLLPPGAWVNVNVQRVKKSAAAYLAKYMSKGGDYMERVAADLGWDAMPSQWWNLTGDLRAWVKREVRSGDAVGALLEQVVNYAFDCNDFDMFHSLRHVELEWDGHTLNVGWCGILTKKDTLHLVGMVSQAA